MPATAARLAAILQSPKAHGLQRPALRLPAAHRRRTTDLRAPAMMVLCTRDVPTSGSLRSGKLSCLTYYLQRPHVSVSDTFLEIVRSALMCLHLGDVKIGSLCCCAAHDESESIALPQASSSHGHIADHDSIKQGRWKSSTLITISMA